MLIKKIAIATCRWMACVVAVHSQSVAPPPAPPAKTPDADAAKAAPVKRVVRSGSEEMTQAIKRYPPEYPMTARQQHIEGAVRLDAIISTDGRVIETKYISGPSELVHASIDALKRWRFKPKLLDGNAVEVKSVFEFTFNLGR